MPNRSRRAPAERSKQFTHLAQQQAASGRHVLERGDCPTAISRLARAASYLGEARAQEAYIDKNRLPPPELKKAGNDVSALEDQIIRTCIR